jgi:uncharacterized membrane-anchored protein
MGRTLTTDDYHKLAEDALPCKFLLSGYEETYTNHASAGTNWNAIRQRVSKMRVEQRKRFEELGWALPDGAAKTPTKTPTKSPRKRAAAGNKGGVDGDAEAESPTKKPRARKPKKEIDEEENPFDEETEDAGVKEKMLEEGV